MRKLAIVLAMTSTVAFAGSASADTINFGQFSAQWQMGARELRLAETHLL